MDQYLHYIGGPAGALALTGVAAASAYYLASRPTPEKPLVPLDDQSYLVPVSQISSFFLLISDFFIKFYILIYQVAASAILQKKS
jgi:hypothetical protein